MWKKIHDYTKAETNKLKKSRKNKKIQEMYKGINEFKKSYQSRAYAIKKDYRTTVTDTTSILSRWEQFYSNLLHIHQSSSSSLEGSEIHITGPHIPEPRL